MKINTAGVCVSSIVYTIFAIQTSSTPVSAGPATAGVSPSATQPVVDVKIENFTFEPKVLQVSVGSTVTWQNADDVPHTATSKDDPQLFDSGAMDTDDKYSFTFKKAGTFAYYCKVHPHMTGLVVVK